MLQLRHPGLAGSQTEVAELIVSQHMRLLQNHQIPELAKKVGVSIEELKQHIEIIQRLDPKPGNRYNPSQSQYVIPDVHVVKVEDQYVAVLNEEGLPQLRISRSTAGCSTREGEQRRDRAYVKDKSARRCG